MRLLIRSGCILLVSLVFGRILQTRELPLAPFPAKRSRSDRRRRWWGWAVVVVSGLAVAAGCGWFLGLRFSTDGFDWTHHLPFRVMLATVALAALLRLLGSVRSLDDRFWTTWWDPSLSRPDGEIDWEDILEMTLGGDHGDALTRPQSFRGSYFWSLAPMHSLGVATFLWVVVMFADRLLKWRLPAFAWAAPGDRGDLVEAVANASGNLTAYLALVAAVVSIVFTYQQLRAKVRADNRQAWIGQARALLARLVADAEVGAASVDAIARRLEVELMLNPSEKDHRLLTFLLQRLSRVREQERIEAGQHLRRVIEQETLRADVARCPRLLGILDERDPGTLVGYVVRLSHVLLKREWERVKHTR